MEVGLQAGNEDNIAPLMLLDRLGVQWVRCDITDGTPSGLDRIVKQFVDSRCKPLFLIRDVAKAELLLNLTLGVLHPDEMAIEIFNEPNYNDISHEVYIQGITQVRNDARARGYTGRLISGAVGNLNDDGFEYLDATISHLPDDILVGFHRYQPGTQVGLFGQVRRAVPWSPFNSRQGELRALHGIARNKLGLACTEFGYHTATEKVWLFSVRMSNEQARDALYEDFKLYEAEDVDIAVVYQYNDGPTDPATGQPKDDFMSRFGIVTGEGQLKPQADAFRKWRDR